MVSGHRSRCARQPPTPYDENSFPKLASASSKTAPAVVPLPSHSGTAQIAGLGRAAWGDHQGRARCPARVAEGDPSRGTPSIGGVLLYHPGPGPKSVAPQGCGRLEVREDG